MNIGAAQKTETLTTSGMNIGAWQEETTVVTSTKDVFAWMDTNATTDIFGMVG